MTQPCDFRSLSIFIVENHGDTLQWTILYLEELGHVVTGVRTMTEALAALPRSGCEVLISDIGLPDGNGWELLERLPAPRPPYAVAMSGFGMNADRARSQAAGYRRHILKPIVPEDLDSVLEEASRTLP